MEQNPERLPKSALSLYVKLYCKRKGDTNTKYCNNLIEATKSWISLNEEEKQQFVDKLEECKVKFKHKFADYLKNVDPYLKKKHIGQIATKDVKRTEHNVNTDFTIQETTEDKLNSPSKTTTKSSVENVDKTTVEVDQSHLVDTFMETEAEYQDVRSEADEQISEPLPEPVPPSVKSAEELFQIVQAMKKNNNKIWGQLTTREKQRYRKAVLSLKKDYIVKYKDYLQSLPSKHLFDLYNKNLDPYFCFKSIY